MKKHVKWSQSFVYTLREAPADAEITSHQLLIRGGFIKKTAPGIYTYGHLALKALRKFEDIIRDELDSRGCVEILMPMVHPRSLWEETDRWDKMGDGLLKFKNRNDHEFCLGATHEEVITDYVRNDIKSYRDLPKTLYQIQDKYRDEIRPRFGLMRGREFFMKDAYTFDADKDSALESYERLYGAYQAIFDRVGLKYRIVQADAGQIGGSQTHEFQVLAESGEDHLMVCPSCDFAANVEISPAILPDNKKFKAEAAAPMEEFATPGLRTIADLAKSLKTEEKDLVKTLFFDSGKDEKNITPIAVLLRGSDELNPIKLKNYLGLSQEPALLSDGMVEEYTGAKPGSCGPVGLKMPVIMDNALEGKTNMIVGANKDDFHLKNVNPERDFKVEEMTDLRRAEPGDSCPKCQSEIQSIRGIEVGHVFYLGQTYSKPMKATYLDKNGKEQTLEMGCYGIGVSRTIQSAIEQCHDKDGMIWPVSIAPYHLHLCMLDPEDEKAQKVLSEIVEPLEKANVEVFVDDRKERPGVKFKDADLLGFPLRLVIGKRGLDNNEIELVERNSKQAQKMPPSEVSSFILSWMEKNGFNG